MKIISLFISLYLCSCVAFVDDATSKTGNHERIVFASLGGTSTLTGANGAHFTHDHQQSLRDAATAIGTGYTAGQTAKATINAANNTTSQQLNASNAATTQAANAAAESDAAAKTAAQEAVTNNAINAGAKVTPITITPP